tara:strand:- start:16 stop:2517 length:2502 start_codon:yes stop_codon:yes gene_type:complete
MEQDSEYDTVDDLDTSTLITLTDLYEAILGPALRQPGVCGILITGTRDMTSTQNGAMAWGAGSVEFPGYEENWQVRSSPKGRMGTPVNTGEVRKVAVLVRSSASNGKAARISILKLWVVPPTNIFTVSNERHKGTYGAHGVNTVGIHIFEHHGRAQIKELGFAMGRNNYRAVMGSYVTATTLPPPGLEVATTGPTAQFFNREGRMVDSVQSCPLHISTIAASLAGCELLPYMSVDLPDTRELDSNLLDEKRSVVNCGLSELLLRKEHARRAHERAASKVFDILDVFEDPPSTDDAVSDPEEIASLRLTPEQLQALESESSALTAASEMLCEQLNHGGFLDMMADSFFDGAMPDSMHRPSGMPMLIAFAVRIACYPDRIGLPPGTADDQFAVREAANLLESFQPAVLPRGIDNGHGARSQPQFAIDIVIQHSVEKMLTELERIRNATPSSASAALKEKLREQGTQVDAIERKVQEALVMFHRAGTSVCVDLCGTIPRRADATSGVYTKFGLAESCCDPVEHAKSAAAYKNNLGYLTPRVDPMRCTSVGARQMALARVLALVERWLCTGTYCGTLLTVEESPGPELVHLNVHSTAASTLSRCFSPSPPLESEEEPPETKASSDTFENLRPLFKEALENTATIVKAGGSKKKLRRAQLRSATSIKNASKPHVKKLAEDEAVQLSMTSRSLRRGMVNSQIVGEAIGSLSKKCQKTGAALSDAVRGLERGSGQAIDDATCIFGTALSCGACLGTTQVVDFQSFLVGEGSYNECANCKKHVNVVQSMVFGGHEASCRNCKHPRCLDCVQFDIDVLGGELDEVDVGPPHRVLQNCLFCCK